MARFFLEAQVVPAFWAAGSGDMGKGMNVAGISLWGIARFVFSSLKDSSELQTRVELSMLVQQD